MPIKLRNPKSRREPLPELIRQHFLDELTEREVFDLAKPPEGPFDGAASSASLKIQQYFWPVVAGGSLAALWQEHSEEIVAEFVEEYPGCRPRLWWTYTAPRCTDEQLRDDLGFKDVHPFFSVDRRHERPAEPRRRLGGIGSPIFEVLAYAPQFDYGLPAMWMSAETVTRYRKGCAIDPTDPPRFESAAAYLQRQGLFLRGEEERLAPEDFEPEIIFSLRGEFTNDHQS